MNPNQALWEKGAMRCVLLLLSLCFAVVAFAEENGIYDHHVHLLSPALIQDWKSIGMEFGRPDEAYSDPTRLIENEHLVGAFLVSMAHLYATEDFRAILKEPNDEWRRVAAENDFIADSVAKHPAFFVGFFSVSPLADYAFDELNRCQSKPNLTGLKLHLPACGVDLNDAAHTSRLDSVLSWAATNDVPVLMHLTAGENVDLDTSLRIWNTIVRPHEKLELYVAHLGSVGGYNHSSHNILEGFRKLAEQDADFRKRAIYFDLSGAIIPEGSEEAQPTSDEQLKRLSDQIERIGVQRFLFASDYPVFSIAQTRAGIATLPISARDRERLMSNRSSRFGRRSTQSR